MNTPIRSYAEYSLICPGNVQGTAVSLMLGVTTRPTSQEGNDRASYPATARFRAANRPGNRTGPAVRARGRAGSGGVRGRGCALPGAGTAARVPAVAI